MQQRTAIEQEQQAWHEQQRWLDDQRQVYQQQAWAERQRQAEEQLRQQASEVQPSQGTLEEEEARLREAERRLEGEEQLRREADQALATAEERGREAAAGASGTEGAASATQPVAPPAASSGDAVQPVPPVEMTAPAWPSKPYAPGGYASPFDRPQISITAAEAEARYQAQMKRLSMVARADYARAVALITVVVAIVATPIYAMIVAVDSQSFAAYIAPVTGIAGAVVGYWFGAKGNAESPDSPTGSG